MAKGNRFTSHYVRREPTRRYKKMYLIATEGEVTEPEYFDWLKQSIDNAVINIKCINKKKGRGESSPVSVLKKMRSAIRENGLSKDDEAWIILDTDSWTREQIQSILDWQDSQHNYECAFSNPKFEYWIILHFENAKALNSHECTERFRRCMNAEGKHLNTSTLSNEKVNLAIERAKIKNPNQALRYPELNGSTVYILVSRILNICV